MNQISYLSQSLRSIFHPVVTGDVGLSHWSAIILINVDDHDISVLRPLWEHNNYHGESLHRVMIFRSSNLRTHTWRRVTPTIIMLWTHFPYYWLALLLHDEHHEVKTLSALLTIWEGNPSVSGSFLHKGTVMFSLLLPGKLLNNSRVAGDLRRHEDMRRECNNTLDKLDICRFL